MIAAAAISDVAPVGAATPAAVEAGVATWAIGSMKLQEAREAEAWRRGEVAAASRSSERPVLGWPSNGPLTGWYGEWRGRRGHVGLDLDGDTGDPIVSAGLGVVEWAGPAPTGYGGYGLMVLVRHSGGVHTLYAHLSRITVDVDDVVEPGDLVGTMGTTGNVTGSHLHFEVRLAGAPVDPRDWLPAR